jgi:hypothetical protein
MLYCVVLCTTHMLAWCTELKLGHSYECLEYKVERLLGIKLSISLSLINLNHCKIVAKIYNRKYKILLH